MEIIHILSPLPHKHQSLLLEICRERCVQSLISNNHAKTGMLKANSLRRLRKRWKYWNKKLFELGSLPPEAMPSASKNVEIFLHVDISLHVCLAICGLFMRTVRFVVKYS